MKKFDFNTFHKLSFPDFEIEYMAFSADKKKLFIVIEGAWFDENTGQILGKGHIDLSDWENIVIKRYNPEADEWINLDILPDEYLKEICETKFEGTTITFCGFGDKSKLWMEWSIKNPTINAEFL